MQAFCVGQYVDVSNPDKLVNRQVRTCCKPNQLHFHVAAGARYRAERGHEHGLVAADGHRARTRHAARTAGQIKPQTASEMFDLSPLSEVIANWIQSNARKTTLYRGS